MTIWGICWNFVSKVSASLASPCSWRWFVEPRLHQFRERHRDSTRCHKRRTTCRTTWYLYQQDWVARRFLPPPVPLPGPLLDVLWGVAGATLWQSPGIGWQSVFSQDKSPASVPTPAALPTSQVGSFLLSARQHPTRAEVPGALVQAWTHSRFSIGAGPTPPSPALPTSHPDPQVSL